MGKNNLSVGYGGGCFPVLRHGRSMRGFAGNALVNRFFPLRNRGSNPPGFLRMRRFPVMQQQRRNSKKKEDFRWLPVRVPGDIPVFSCPLLCRTVVCSFFNGA